MMNFTCNMLAQRQQWHALAIATFVPAYPTSIFGSEDNRKVQGFIEGWDD
jgi:hypothetical protein